MKMASVDGELSWTGN